MIKNHIQGQENDHVFAIMYRKKSKSREITINHPYASKPLWYFRELTEKPSFNWAAETTVSQ